MGTVFEELRYAARILSRRKMLTAVAVATLGLGIGLTTAMFSIVDGVALRGLPVERPRDLRYLERTFESDVRGNPTVPPADFVEWRRSQHAFTTLAAFELTTLNISGTPSRPQRYGGALVSAQLFDLLGVRPAVGRGFLEGEDRPGASPVVIISDVVWRDHFGRNPRLDGLTLRTDGEVRAIVGVMPPGFRFPSREDVWIPLVIDEHGAGGTTPTFEVLGRLAPGVTPAEAQTEMSALAARLAEEHADTHRGVGIALRTHMSKFLGDQAIGVLYTGLLAVVGVLLIAATNVTNLLLALASLRTRDVAIRAALGAGRRRLLFQPMLEALILAIAGGALGFALARVGITFFNEAIAGTNPPFWVDIRMEARESLFLAALVAVVTVVAGTMPAVRASGIRAGDILRDEGRGSSGRRLGRFSRALVMTEVALSCGLLVAAGLMVRTVLTVRHTDFGFSTRDVLAGTITLPASAYSTGEERRRFWNGLLHQLEQQPGVRAVALVSDLPGTGSGRIQFALAGTDAPSSRDRPRARVLIVSPDFFGTFGVSIADGRDFTAADTTGTGLVTIVNRRFVRRFFEGQSPVGRSIRLASPAGELTSATVIGVVPDMRLGGVLNRDPEAVFLPMAQQVRPTLSVAVRARGDPATLGKSVRDVVAELDPDLPVYALQPMTQVLYLTTWFYGVFGAVFIAFGAVALALVIIGLYGLMAFSVARRTREIGLRMAIGAGRGDVVRMVLGQGAVQLAVGLAAGVGLAMFLSRLLVVFLVGVRPWDPGVFATVLIGLLATGMLACLPPALNAMRTDPNEALRHE
jgi:putative ABC transport system permease protein